jgi:FkbM family methyltransferase
MRQLLKSIWPSFGEDIEWLLKWLIEKRSSRSILNEVYNRLTYDQKDWFHARFAKLFRNRECTMDPGRWTVAFFGREIYLPLRKETMWLDWDCALSTLGHDSEVKISYETLIRELGFPRCFFDVGANYGLHSLLFLVHGIEVVSFEPNPTCRDYVHSLEAANHIGYCLEPIALGASEGEAQLRYPDMETWLGTICTEDIRGVPADRPLQRVEIRCSTLDGIARERGCVPDLVKLDTEGSEYQILVGARETLESGRPTVIFESWRGRNRTDIWQFFSDMEYLTVKLPLLSLDGATVLDFRAFSSSEHSNFVALPREMLSSKNVQC